ncbi:MAG: homoserine O-succinyltransferase [Clostridia bacterium]|nr:homoserine O-succinyltransferase [Clostridia bacterium]
MPICIPNTLPSRSVLQQENIFVMDEHRASRQDIRPLHIAIFNIMPTKIATETQLLRMLSNTPLQVEITLLHPASHTSRNTAADHLASFYKTFDDVKNKKFDGMILTGAPVEMLMFDEVTYWDELCRLMEWTKTHVYSTLHLCWGAQAALYYHYQVPKYPLPEKKFGVFKHEITGRNIPLFRGFDDTFYMPHSRHTEIRRADIDGISALDVVSESQEAGVAVVMTRNGRQIFVTGHGEYDPDTLKQEYLRDMEKGMDNVPFPAHYFPDDDPSRPPIVRWRAHSSLLFSNWLNYYVYQETPFDLNLIECW